jgi:hypothetical protein
MKAHHKKFILKELAPFIKRDNGRGFGITVWRHHFLLPHCVDGVVRHNSQDGTCACIGGSVEILKGYECLGYDDGKISSALGLKRVVANGLLFGYEPNCSFDYAWPMKFRTSYAAARSTRGKAKVVVALLKEVVRTNGECLRRSK